MVLVKDRLLFILYLLGEFNKGQQSFSLERIFSFFPVSKPKRNLYATISYAVKSGDVKKTTNGSKLLLQLTPAGRKKLQKDFPLVSFRKEEWDGRWRVLIYDIPDSRKSQREMLRRKIRKYGFEKLQSSIYVSPFAIEKIMVDFLETHKLTNGVVFMTADAIFSGGDKYLAENIWKLSRLNMHYESLLEELSDKRLDDKDLCRLRAELVGLLESDPFLPEELLPKPWHREAVIKKLL